jgi:hypothetical protein
MTQAELDDFERQQQPIPDADAAAAADAGADAAEVQVCAAAGSLACNWLPGNAHVMNALSWAGLFDLSATCVLLPGLASLQ